MTTTRDDLGTIYIGTTWTGTFTWTDANGVPVNVTTGYTAAARIGIEGRAAIVAVTTGSGINLGSGGTFTVTLTPTQTTLLRGAGTISVDLDAIHTGTGVITAIARGTATVLNRVEDSA